MESLERSRAGEQKESVESSFVISESSRLIPLKMGLNEVKPNLGTLRLVASMNDEKQPIDVLIQVTKDGRPCLSFTVPREDITHAGEVFDLLISDPYAITTEGVSIVDPLTEEKIAKTFKTITRTSKLPDAHPPRDDVRQSILSIISRGITPYSATSSGKNEDVPSLETMLTGYIEATLRGNAQPEKEKEPPAIKERVATSVAKLADNLVYGPKGKQKPSEPKNH